jgi:hypothetical protein
MSWLFSRVLVEAYLEENCLDGELFALSNGKPTPLAFCAPDRMKAHSRLSRYGATFAPLTEDLGEGLLKWYQGVFPVRTYPSREKVTDSMESVQECGTKWRGWLAKFDPNSSLWRIAQCSLLEEESESLQTLPRWGMTANGLLWELPMLAHHTKGTEFGYSLPTPTTNPEAPNKNANTKGPKSLAEVANGQWNHLFPTPNVWDGKRGPMSKELMETGKHQVSLVTYIKHNPTKWGTPKAQDSRHALTDRGKGNLGEQVSGQHNGGKLNPLWVEWLMGYPIGWTDLSDAGMDKSPCALQPLGDS